LKTKNQEPKKQDPKKKYKVPRAKKFQIKNLKGVRITGGFEILFFCIFSLVLGFILYSFFGSWRLGFLVLCILVLEFNIDCV